MTITYRQYNTRTTTGLTATLGCTKIVSAPNDFITVSMVHGGNSDATAWVVSNDGSPITWTKQIETNTASNAKVVVWTGTAGVSPPNEISVSVTAGTNPLFGKSLWVGVHTNAHATTPFPAGNNFSGTGGTAVSQAITPTSSGSALWMHLGDFSGSLAAFVPIANNTLEAMFFESGQQSTATMRPTVQPRTDGASFTLGSSTGTTVAWAAYEVQAAVGATINTQPVDANYTKGSNATFTVSATASAGSLSYQWQDNRTGAYANVTDGLGGTSATYTTGTLTASDANRKYIVVITDSNGVVTSNVLSLALSTVPTFSIKRRKRISSTYDYTALGWFHSDLVPSGIFSKDIIVLASSSNISGIASSKQQQESKAVALLSFASVSGVSNSSQSQYNSAVGSVTFPSINGIGNSSQAQVNNAIGSVTFFAISAAGQGLQSQSSSAVGSVSFLTINAVGQGQQAQYTNATPTVTNLTINGISTSSQQQNSLAIGSIAFTGVLGAGGSNQQQANSAIGTLSYLSISGIGGSTQKQSAQAVSTVTFLTVNGNGQSLQSQYSGAIPTVTSLAIIGSGASNQSQITQAIGSVSFANTSGVAKSEQSQSSNAVCAVTFQTIFNVGSSLQKQSAQAIPSIANLDINGISRAEQSQLNSALATITLAGVNAFSVQSQSSKSVGQISSITINESSLSIQCQSSQAVGDITFYGIANSQQSQSNWAVGLITTSINNIVCNSAGDQSASAVGLIASTTVNAIGESKQAQEVRSISSIESIIVNAIGISTQYNYCDVVGSVVVNGVCQSAQNQLSCINIDNKYYFHRAWSPDNNEFVFWTNMGINLSPAATHPPSLVDNLVNKHIIYLY